MKKFSRATRRFSDSHQPPWTRTSSLPRCTSRPRVRLTWFVLLWVVLFSKKLARALATCGTSHMGCHHKSSEAHINLLLCWWRVGALNPVVSLPHDQTTNHLHFAQIQQFSRRRGTMFPTCPTSAGACVCVCVRPVALVASMLVACVLTTPASLSVCSLIYHSYRDTYGEKVAILGQLLCLRLDERH